MGATAAFGDLLIERLRVDVIAGLVPCPICGGHGRTQSRARVQERAPEHVCALCIGARYVAGERLQSFDHLRGRMQRVADRMQAGDADGAAQAARLAARIASAMLS